MTHAEMGSTALWLMLLLGAYHGINPGMGWLFAVALGMQERKGTAVARALVRSRLVTRWPSAASLWLRCFSAWHCRGR